MATCVVLFSFFLVDNNYRKTRRGEIEEEFKRNAGSYQMLEILIGADSAQFAVGFSVRIEASHYVRGDALAEILLGPFDHVARVGRNGHHLRKVRKVRRE